MVVTYDAVKPATAPALEAPPLDVVMNHIGTHPGKLATVIALAGLAPGEYASSIDLCHRLNALQEGEPGWDYNATHTTAFSYCRTSLAKGGLVEYSSRPSAQRGKTVEIVRLNEYGRTAGMTVAGALLALEVEALPTDCSLQHAMGAAAAQVPKGGGEPSRLAMFRHILGLDGGAASVTDLKIATGVKPGTATTIVDELCRTGIMTRDDRLHPASYKYSLTEPQRVVDSNLSRMMPETRMAVQAAQALYRQGRRDISGADVLDAVRAGNPDADMHKVWDMFLHWVGDRDHPDRFIVEHQLTENRNIRTQLRIAEAWQPFLSRLLKIRDLLTATGEEADAFRAEAQRHAYELANPQPDQIASTQATFTAVLGKAKGDSRYFRGAGHTDWASIIHEHIPEDGIDAVELHKIVTGTLGRQISYQKFQSRLAGVARVTLTEVPGTGRGRRSRSHVTLTPQVFPADWEAKAVCLNGKTDPELFFPTGTEGPAVTQAEKAKRICHGCPVRLACLKTALDRGESGGVWGEVWFEKIDEELPAPRRQYVRNSVVIQISNAPRSRTYGGTRQTANKPAA